MIKGKYRIKKTFEGLYQPQAYNLGGWCDIGFGEESLHDAQKRIDNFHKKMFYKPEIFEYEPESTQNKRK